MNKATATPASQVVVQLAIRLPYFFGIEIYQAPAQPKKITHRPRGMMCTTCTDKAKNCSGLPFESMRAIGKDTEGLSIVICTQHQTAPRQSK